MSTPPRIERLVSDIGHAQRELQHWQARLDEAIAKVKDDFAKQMEPHNATIAKNTDEVFKWAEANRDELLTDGTKTVVLTTGALSWRIAPRAVEVRDAKRILEKLQERGLAKFIRDTPSINKEAILAAKSGTGLVEGIRGLRVTQDETFTIKPNGDDTLEIAVPIKTKAVA